MFQQVHDTLCVLDLPSQRWADNIGVRSHFHLDKRPRIQQIRDEPGDALFESGDLPNQGFPYRPRFLLPLLCSSKAHRKTKDTKETKNGQSLRFVDDGQH
jgi:hypothetical protein